tara:strand:+ start:468 stop:695 length:228 start_codon:yes stop_codon:yes gene_type:complete
MKRVLILQQKKSHLPAVVKIINNLFKLEKQKVIVVSGYFNPIHKGYLEYFNNTKAIAYKLFVIVNNDFQKKLKRI